MQNQLFILLTIKESQHCGGNFPYIHNGVLWPLVFLTSAGMQWVTRVWKVFIRGLGRVLMRLSRVSWDTAESQGTRPSPLRLCQVAWFESGSYVTRLGMCRVRVVCDSARYVPSPSRLGLGRFFKPWFRPTKDLLWCCFQVWWVVNLRAGTRNLEV